MTQFKPKKFVVPLDKRYHYDVFQIMPNPEDESEEIALHVCPTGKEEEANAIVEALATVDYIIAQKAGIKIPARYVTRARAKDEHTVYRSDRREIGKFIERIEYHPAFTFEADVDGVDITEFVKGGYGKCDDPNCACRTFPPEQLYEPTTTWLRGEELSRDSEEIIKAKRAIRAAKKKKGKK